MFQPRSAAFQGEVGDDIRPVLEAALLQVRVGLGLAVAQGTRCPECRCRPAVLHAVVGRAGS